MATPTAKTPAPESTAPPSGLGSRLLLALAAEQTRAPWRFLIVALILVSVSLMLATRLEIRPGFAALLPENRASVLELERVKQRTRGVSTVFIVLEGDDSAAMRQAADALVTELRTIGYPWVGSAENGVHAALAFMKPRAGMFAKTKELERLRDDVDERYEYEVGKATGATLDLDDDYEPPKLDAETLKKRFGLNAADADKYPGGYFQSADGKSLIIALRSALSNTDYERGNEALRLIRERIGKVNPKGYHPSIRYGLAGDLVTGLSELQAINDDLTDVGLLGALLIILVVFLYYLRVRTLIAMVLTIGIGVSLTFGLTQLLIGHLNMATGFLFTIIAGNGINPGIIFMSRYLEGRRRGRSVELALSEAHHETWLPTLTASCAASAAYASLVITEFRGFRDFGVIGGFGMVLCWAATFAFLPPMLIVTERISPIEEGRSGLFGLLPKSSAGGTRFGAPFAALVSRLPGTVALIGGMIAIVGTIGTIRYVQSGPMEYDLRNLRTDMSARAEEIRLTRLAENTTGLVGLDGMAILVDRVEQVPQLVAKLEAKRNAAPEGSKPFKAVHTLQDFVPDDQAAKIILLNGIKDKLLRSRKRGFIDDEAFAKIEPYLPPDNIKPFGLDGLPNGMARAFTERDGTRGRIVYISPTAPGLIDDAHYLFRWADSYRETKLDDGSTVLGSGRAVIYADMWRAVVNDVPRAVLLSFIATLLVIAFAFRAGFAAWAIMVALITGVVWMTGLLSVAGVRLNFLNFIALPITFGIGVDYAVNVMQRYRREGPGGALTAVRETGGAVVLCSMTTTLGYLALYGSVNYAVRSLGIAAVLGELACLLAAVIALPGALVWLDNRRQARSE